MKFKSNLNFKFVGPFINSAYLSVQICRNYQIKKQNKNVQASHRSKDNCPLIPLHDAQAILGILAGSSRGQLASQADLCLLASSLNQIGQSTAIGPVYEHAHAQSEKTKVSPLTTVIDVTTTSVTANAVPRQADSPTRRFHHFAERQEVGAAPDDACDSVEGICLRRRHDQEPTAVHALPDLDPNGQVRRNRGM